MRKGGPADAALLIVIGYVVFTVVGLALLEPVLQDIRDPGMVPRWMWMAFGPLIALRTGHGVLAYAGASILCVPLLIGWKLARARSRVFFGGAALVAWVLIGASLA